MINTDEKKKSEKKLQKFPQISDEENQLLQREVMRGRRDQKS